MLKWKGISNSFWVEAINIAIYILNFSTKAILNKTYIKLGMDINPRSINKKCLDSGCIAYAQIPKQEREKFDKKERRISLVATTMNQKAGSCSAPKPLSS